MNCGTYFDISWTQQLTALADTIIHLLLLNSSIHIFCKSIIEWKDFNARWSRKKPNLKVWVRVTDTVIKLMSQTLIWYCTNLIFLCNTLPRAFMILFSFILIRTVHNALVLSTCFITRQRWSLWNLVFFKIGNKLALLYNMMISICCKWLELFISYFYFFISFVFEAGASR